MANCKWRLYETLIDDGKPIDRLMREETYWGIGHEIVHWYTLTVTHIKRNVTREAIGNRYFRAMYSATKERVPEGVDMGRWKEKPHIAENLGCAYFFVKESKDKKYRLELEVNYEGG